MKKSTKHQFVHACLSHYVYEKNDTSDGDILHSI